ncbi:unnamed protein product [Protopolystoma xenopodis]|uniref:Uncharacterized protein n=1 Tax=Protopolystoma xenopodis TaxID=117903 RepID=A0A3S5ARB6_9PLAT|nr:unnamed protein product [Protopolystoma xenopodis]
MPSGSPRRYNLGQENHVYSFSRPYCLVRTPNKPVLKTELRLRRMQPRYQLEDTVERFSNHKSRSFCCCRLVRRTATARVTDVDVDVERHENRAKMKKTCEGNCENWEPNCGG